ncbi:MAG: IS110 family transposase [Gammaproteobacteria bacterium]|nr:IS110 family transposase [Gammaproteobacteria bacterium]
MRIIRFGIDLAKNTFAVCGVDAREQPVLQRTLRRAELLPFFAQQPAALVAMEAGSGAHHWARELIGLGHDARLIAACFVAPYRRQGQTGKNDRNDAAAICEAAGRPNMRFIPVKSAAQQALLVVHRVRAGLVAEHTRVANQLRGLLAEFGVVLPKGVNQLKQRWFRLRLEQAEAVPARVWTELDALQQRLRELHQTILDYDREIRAAVRDDEAMGRLAQGPQEPVGRTTETEQTVEQGRRRARQQTCPYRLGPAGSP